MRFLVLDFFKGALRVYVPVVHVCAVACMCEHMRKSKVNFGCVQLLCTLIFEQGLPLNYELSVGVCLSDPEFQEFACSCCPPQPPS